MGHKMASQATVRALARKHKAPQAIVILYDGKEYSATAWGEEGQHQGAISATLDVLGDLVVSGTLPFRPTATPSRTHSTTEATNPARCPDCHQTGLHHCPALTK